VSDISRARDDWNFRVGHGVDERGQVGEPVGAQTAQVEAGAERRVGSGQHDGAGILGRRDRLAQSRRQLQVHGVARVRAV
jgi:hypothetical protein